MIDIKDISHAPSLGEIGAYIGFPLFDTFCQYMDTEYKAIRKIEYSKDVWARGWNVKFKKSGKSLCTIYPREGYFTVLVVIGSKVKEAVENILCDCAPELRELYEKTRWGNGQKWLMIDLEDQGEMFADVLQLIEIRRG